MKIVDLVVPVVAKAPEKEQRLTMMVAEF